MAVRFVLQWLGMVVLVINMILAEDLGVVTEDMIVAVADIIEGAHHPNDVDLAHDPNLMNESAHDLVLTIVENLSQSLLGSALSPLNVVDHIVVVLFQGDQIVVQDLVPVMSELTYANMDALCIDTVLPSIVN